MLKNSTLAFKTQLENGQTKIYQLPQVVPTFASASQSVILSLASYLTWKYPCLPHPDYTQLQLKAPVIAEPFPNQHLSFHLMYEPWTDLLCKAVTEDCSARLDSTLYIVISVSSQYSTLLDQHDFIKTIKEGDPTIQGIFNLPKIQPKKKKIVFVNFATSQLRQNHLLPKVSLPGLIMGILFDNQSWSIYSALKGDIPMKQQLAEADTIIFPGSSNSVLDSIEPINLLVSQLKQALAQNPNIKILSICYGHQLISKIHGATVARKKRYEGHEFVKFDQNICLKYPFLKSITDNKDKQFIMPEHHQDYVETVPEGFQLIATSASCYVEAMISKSGKMLSFQFHPQYFSQFTIAYTKRILQAKLHSCFSFALPVQQEKLEIHHESCRRVRMCIRDFIAS